MKLNRVSLVAGSVGLAVGILLGGISMAVQAPQMATEPPKTEVRWNTLTSTATATQKLTETSVLTSVLVVNTTQTTAAYVDVTQYDVATETVTVTQVVDATPTTEVASEAPALVEPSTTPSSALPDEPKPAPANWMEEALPQVDGNGLGVWLFEENPVTGAWGTTDGHTVWISPDVPDYAQWSVMVHEYSHLLQAQYYGSLDAAAGQVDIESLADCMANELGATFNYYGCDEALVPLARAILS